jgi:hypothetical protein
MRRSRVCAGIVAGVALVVAAGSIAEAQQHVYPTKGQSQSKQKQDKAACSKWARKQSGYDPAHPPVVAKAEAAPVTGSGARARGAAGGALIGAIGGNAGAGAAAGAVAGGIRRRVRNNNAAEEQNQASAQHVADMRASYYRARGACLSGRGYSVE